MAVNFQKTTRGALAEEQAKGKGFSSNGEPGQFGGLTSPGVERNPGLAHQDQNPFTGDDAPKG